jgi:hypothetical protein
MARTNVQTFSGDVEVTSNLEVGTANLFVDTQTGNVGIGTTAPQYKLDTRGDAVFDTGKDDSTLTGLLNYSSTQSVIDAGLAQSSSTGSITASTDINPPPGVAGDVIAKYVNSHTTEIFTRQFSASSLSITTGDVIYFGLWVYATLDVNIGIFKFGETTQNNTFTATGNSRWTWYEKTITSSGTTSNPEFRIDNDSAGKTYYFTGYTIRKNPSQTTGLPFTPIYSPASGRGAVLSTQTLVAQDVAFNGEAKISGLTYGLKLSGTLDSTKTSDWYRLLVGDNRDGGNGMRTSCKLLVAATGLHHVVTFDFNHMVSLSQTSGNSFNLLGNDHYISRNAITKLRVATTTDGKVALDMLIDHDVVLVDRDWTIQLYVDGGSLISAPTTFLEKITATPSASIELSTDTSIFGIVGNQTSRSLTMSENGNVGIGTDSPSYKLDVHGTSNVGALTATTATVPNDGDFIMNSKPLVSTTGLHWDRVNSRLGVGTNSPSYKLDVAGDISSSGTIWGNGSGLTNLNASNLASGTVNNNLLNTASITGAGIVQLSTSTSGTSTTKAATESAVKAAYDRSSWGTGSFSDVLKLGGGSTTGDSSVEDTNKTNTYIRFGEAGTGSDWAYLRQIGGDNAIKLALDFHDDNEARFEIRKVNSSSGTGAGEVATTVFSVDDGVVTATSFSGSGSSLTNLNASNLASGTVNNNLLNTASTTGAGIVQLSTSTSGTSTTKAATESAVKAAYDRSSWGSGTFSGDVEVTGTLSTKSDVSLGVMSGHETEGTLKFARADGTDRVHNIKVYNSSTQASNYMKFQIHAGGASAGALTDNVLYLRGDGNVGIGTDSPSYKLDVHGTSNVGALTATTATVPNDGDFVMSGKPLKPAGGLHWDSLNSRLGVGTNSPAYKLDVSGTGRFTGTVTAPTFSGNATTATALETARTINGVSFNGSGNITVEPYISSDDTGDTNCPIVFTANSTTGYKRLYEDSTLYFNNTDNILYSPTFSGSLSGNVSGGTVNATSYTLTGDSTPHKQSIKNSTDLSVGWYRIAENGDAVGGASNGTRCSARFTIIDYDSGLHSTRTLYAGGTYGNKPFIHLLTNTSYGSDGNISKVRVVEGSIYEGLAVEIYVDIACNANEIRIVMDDNYQESGFTMVNFESVVANHSNMNEYELDLNTTFWGMFLNNTTTNICMLENGNVGIGTASPSYKLDVHGTSNVGALTATTATVPNDGDFIMNSKPLVSATGLHWDRLNSRLGVGTTSPSSKLHVFGGTLSADTDLATFHYTNGNQSYLKIRQVNHTPANASWTGWSTRIQQVTDVTDQSYIEFNPVGGTYATAFGRGGNEYMRIKSDGNVGIGTASPQGLLHISSGTSGDAHLILEADTDNNNEGDNPMIVFKQDGTLYEGMIGLDSTNNLHLKTAVGNGGEIKFSTINQDETTIGGLASNAIQRMVITNTGDVGIGETSPSYKLDVNGDTRVGNVLYIGKETNDETAKTIYFGGTYGDNAYGHCVIENRVWSTATEKHELLLFSGNDDETSAGPDRIRLKGAQILFDTYTSATTDRTTESTKMIIRADGDVGIGTTSPAYKLDVDGTIYASGDVIMFSDERKKTNIETIPNALDKVLQLRGVTFDKLDDDNRRHAGVIAQEVEKVLPEVVYTAEDGTKSVAYGNMIGLLIEAIKELAAK